MLWDNISQGHTVNPFEDIVFGTTLSRHILFSRLRPIVLRTIDNTIPIAQ